MLIELRAQNHRSLREEQVISFDPGPGSRLPDELLHSGLLRVGALYGANASGKTNALHALAWMRDAVLRSARAWDPEGGVPREPFAWGPPSAGPSLFEVRLRLPAGDFTYGFTTSTASILEEWLFADGPEGREPWFTRADGRIQLGAPLEGDAALVADHTRPNALFLSTAVQLRARPLTPVYRWFHEATPVRVGPGEDGPSSPASSALRGWVRTGPPQQVELPLTPPQSAGREAALLDLLRVADLGVHDLAFLDDGGARRLHLRHGAGADGAWLPVEAESRGTRALLQLAPRLLHALESGGLVLVDELEASLHPLLARHLLRRFDDPATNPRGAQLLFTTHDTQLLSEAGAGAPLRREQVWLTEKDDQGGTHIVPLADYTPFPGTDTEKGYLQGRYGAVPFLGLDLAQGGAAR
jgi:hypothetical protein